jgi:hypothetical protein
MTKLELLEFLTAAAKRYRLDCAPSVARNAHMNECGGECDADQRTVDAILVGFVNRIGTDMGVDYALYTRDIR